VEAIADLKVLHRRIEKDITKRLKEFSQMGMNGTEHQLFSELAFCLLTPQSKALFCWSAVECLIDSDLLLKGKDFEIAREIKSKARFHNQKAKNVVMARELFTDPETGKINVRKQFASFENVYELRDWLVENIRGMGYKEASHFIRNIGKGKNLAILDRHILRNLVELRVIPEIPTSPSPRRYTQIEAEMLRFCGYINMRMDHLDLVLWYKQTGEVFK